MHQTVREFFRPEGPTTQTMLWIESNDAHKKISMTCIRYLMLCAAKAASIDRAEGGEPWTTESFVAYAKYLSGRLVLNYALEFVERHLKQYHQMGGDSELTFQLHRKLNEILMACILGNWNPQAWGQRIPSHKQQDYGKHFRSELLHAATRMNYSQVVDALLIAGAEVEACLEGKTPVMATAGGGDLATARVLLDRGALIGASNGNKQTALHLAAANGHNLVSGLLIDRGADKEAKDEKGQAPLHLAAANGHDPVARLLVDRGADKEVKDNEGQTALHHAAANGHNDVIGLLVDRGANKKSKDRFGWGLLHMAACNGHGATIQMLVTSLDANKEERDKCGWTALHVAAMNRCDTASRCLIEQLGVNKEAKDDVGWTALHFVAALGLEETVQLLIKIFDVDSGARNKDGRTAEDLVQEL